MFKNVFLSLGSNVGNKKGFINKALSVLQKSKEIKIINHSGFYETEPWGIKEQEYFLNMVIRIETVLNAYKLLDFIKQCEIKTGRVKRERWKEREIDIDILFFNDVIIEKNLIHIPHKEIPNRKFVLVPLNEIAPDFIHPQLQKSVKELLANTKDKSEIKIFDNFD